MDSQGGYSSPGIFRGRVVARNLPCVEHFILDLAVEGFPPARPGQFLQVLCRPTGGELGGVRPGVLLRRPFSIGGLREEGAGRVLTLLGRVVGPGTAWLEGRRPGDEVNVLGPLGRPFASVTEETLAVLVAGGVGLPPIQWMCEILRENGVPCLFLYGALRRALIPLTLACEPSIAGEVSACVRFSAPDPVDSILTTDDGSCGLRGKVTDALSIALARARNRAVRVYACGPEPMLAAVARLCAEADVSCEVAMERVMGCGMGTCQSCVVPIRRDDGTAGPRYALCCTDGPVFDARRVLWEDATG